MPPLAGGKVVRSTKGGGLWYRLTAMSINCCLSAAPPLVAGATTFLPIQGALWVLGSGGNLSLWQQRRENHTTGFRPEENKPTALAGDGNAPLLPPAAASSPEGEILAPLCIEMFMSLEAERRENFPLRGKWCDSTKRGAFPARRRRGC